MTVLLDETRSDCDSSLWPELVETAARATINERCASAFLHDVRGTMQALFSAFELLGRSAKSSGADTVRVERACDLARRAISHHEKSTMNVLQILTLHPSAAVTVELPELVNEVAHFLRNDATIKRVTVDVSSVAGVSVSVDRAKLQTLLVGLLSAAIDQIAAGSELVVSIRRIDGDAVVSFGSDAGFAQAEGSGGIQRQGLRPLHPRELTLLFARHFLAANGGRFVVDPAAQPFGAMHLHYPCV